MFTLFFENSSQTIPENDEIGALVTNARAFGDYVPDPYRCLSHLPANDEREDHRVFPQFRRLRHVLSLMLCGAQTK